MLDVVTTMCDHVIEYIEADRAERRLMIEALTTLAKSLDRPNPAPIAVATATAPTTGTRSVVASM